MYRITSTMWALVPDSCKLKTPRGEFFLEWDEQRGTHIAVPVVIDDTVTVATTGPTHYTDWPLDPRD